MKKNNLAITLDREFETSPEDEFLELIKDLSAELEDVISKLSSPTKPALIDKANELRKNAVDLHGCKNIK